MQKRLSHNLLVFISFLALYLVWGTTYLVIVIGLEGFPPFFMAGLRFIIAAICLVGYSLYMGDGLPKKRSIIKNIILGLIVMAGGQGLLIWSEQYIASGYASVLVATLPIWFVLMDRSNWKFYFNNIFILVGIVLGFCGILVLFHEQLYLDLPEESIRIQILASLAVIFGGICWVSGTLYNRSRPAAGTMYQNLGWQLLAGSVICFFLSLIFGEFREVELSKVSWTAWSAVFYLGLASNIGAFIAYTWLLSIYPSAIVGTYAYINPIVAVILGWWLAGEIITGQQLVGMIIILISAVLININRNKGKHKA